MFYAIDNNGDVVCKGQSKGQVRRILVQMGCSEPFSFKIIYKER